MTRERVLVDFFYAQPVGHAVEALQASDRYLVARRGRSVIGATPPGYVPRCRLRLDRRRSTALRPAELRELLSHHSAPVDCFDIDLVEQLAIVESCNVFLSPHTGFSLAALAVGTPWLTISGGPWFECYFNHVPFRSILPDVERYPAFSQFRAPDITDDG
jgi:hypothetical protein